MHRGRKNKKKKGKGSSLGDFSLEQLNNNL